MEIPHIKTIIYKLENSVTKKCYIGQTTTHKFTRGKYYDYTISHRFSEHIGASKRKRTTAICQAIREYGPEVFSISELERCNTCDADKTESKWIKKLDTCSPNGYNIQKCSRTKNKDDIPLENVISIEIRGIKKANKLNSARVIATTKDDARHRFMFSGKTFEESVDRAYSASTKLVSHNDINLHSSLFDREEKWWAYKEKLESFDVKTIVKIKFNLFNNTLVRLYITTSEMTNYKQNITLTFGGKKIKTSDALEIADSVLKEIIVRHNEIDPLKMIDEDKRLAPYRSQKGGCLSVEQDTREGKQSTCSHSSECTV